MKTKEFPAVIEARKIVLHRMAFYKSMMEGTETKASQQPQKKTPPKKMSATLRKKSGKQQVACTA